MSDDSAATGCEYFPDIIPWANLHLRTTKTTTNNRATATSKQIPRGKKEIIPQNINVKLKLRVENSGQQIERSKQTTVLNLHLVGWIWYIPTYAVGPLTL